MPNLGFRDRDTHASLIQEERLIAGVNFLGEPSDKLQQNYLLVKDRLFSGAGLEGAEAVARYGGLVRGTSAFKHVADGAVA